MSGRETSDPFAPLLGGVHIYSYSDAIVTIARVTLDSVLEAVWHRSLYTDTPYEVNIMVTDHLI